MNEVMKNVLCLFAVLLVAGLVSSCSVVQSSMWTSFVDELGTGSKIEPESPYISSKGEIHVKITKAASPKWVPGKELDYPYAGIMMFLAGWGKPLDLSAADGLLIEYRLKGSLNIKLKQKGIPAGREYTIELEPYDVYTTRLIPWSDFAQPKWVQEPVVMNLTEIIGLMFVNNSDKLSTADLSIRNISFPNWENPDSVIFKMKQWRKSHN